MARLPPTRKYRKRKPGRDRPLPPPAKGELRILQVRSGIGRPAFERRTLETPGLKHHQEAVVQKDRPAVPGKRYQMRHPGEVTPAQVVNVRHLGKLAEGVEVTPETLFGAGLVRRPDHPIKLLGMGDVQRKFSVKGVTVSASARSKIEQAGGTIAS